ncbi:unnamed protein product, partial [Effrenium voratum]
GSLGEPPNQRARPLFKFFVADLERYKLRVGHSLNRNSGDDIASSAMLGFWRRPRRRSDSWNPMDLLNRKPDVAPIKCMNTSTPRCTNWGVILCLPLVFWTFFHGLWPLSFFYCVRVRF